HPLYAALTSAVREAEGAGERAPPDGSVMWNFEKFLLGRDGKVARRFAPAVKPDDPSLVDAIEAELAK
ncbi:MAG TPA: glutathione peroxidase, partial [Caulobacteraceae bacterium]|nr:glutathione peroxidase [Caulobacteraceae bacterium]